MLLLSHALAAALAAAPNADRAEPNPFLVQAKVFQQSLEFEKCLRRLDQAAKWRATSEAERAQIDLYSALCKLGLGRELDAELHFERALKADPQLQLPPLQGPRVERVFEKVKGRMDLPVPVATEPAAPEPARLLPLEPPPSPPPAVEARPTRVAPPLLIGGLSAAAGVVAVVLGVRAQAFADQGRAAEFGSDAARLRGQAQLFALGANVLYAIAGAALVACIITFFALN